MRKQKTYAKSLDSLLMDVEGQMLNSNNKSLCKMYFCISVRHGNLNPPLVLLYTVSEFLTNLMISVLEQRAPLPQAGASLQPGVPGRTFFMLNSYEQLHSNAL